VETRGDLKKAKGREKKSFSNKLQDGLRVTRKGVRALLDIGATALR